MLYFLFFATLFLTFFMISVNLDILYTFLLKTPMLPTSAASLRGLKLVLAEYGKDNLRFYDLGSGNGKVTSFVANNFPRAVCTGVERNVGALLKAKMRNVFAKNKISYKYEDLFTTDLGNADVVYAYLFPQIVHRLENKLEKELRPGSLVILNTFPLKHKLPEKIIPQAKGKLGGLYVYKY